MDLVQLSKFFSQYKPHKRNYLWSALLIVCVGSFQFADKPDDGIESVTQTNSSGLNSSGNPSVVDAEKKSKSEHEHEQLVDTYGQLPLRFEQNKGQVDDQIKFLSRGSGYSLFLTSSKSAIESIFALNRSSEKSEKGSVIHMQLVNSDPNAAFKGEEELPGKVNYLMGADQNDWHTQIPTFKTVVAEEVYAGIDVRFHSAQQQFEYDFVVAPGATYGDIRLSFEGVQDISVNSEGHLILETKEGQLQHKKPIVYQTINGKRMAVEGSYQLVSDVTNIVNQAVAQIGFNIGDYHPDHPLIIDPVVDYSTYLGGDGDETDVAIDIDTNGNIYISGVTDSQISFPINNALQQNYGGGQSDIFVTKLSADGSTLIYSTYFGGSFDETRPSITVDSLGQSHIAGVTDSNNFPVLNAYQSSYGGSLDGFITKMNADGDALIYSTYLGGNDDDLIHDITLDAQSQVYVTGQTLSSNFPIANAYQNSISTDYDGFVTKLSLNGSSLDYSTYLGGESIDKLLSITVDALGQAYVAGSVEPLANTPVGQEFPVLNAQQASYGGGGKDAIIARLGAGGNALGFSTFLGGLGTEEANALVLGKNNSVNVTGWTGSLNFPLLNPIQDTYGGGNSDAFITSYSASGALLNSTYLGGGDDDVSYAIQADNDGYLYIIGDTNSEFDFPTNDPLQSFYGGGTSDAFVSKVDLAQGVIDFSSFFGGLEHDSGRSLVYQEVGQIVIAGLTGSSSDFPLAAAMQPVFGGGVQDAFIAKINDIQVARSSSALTTSVLDIPITQGSDDAEELSNGSMSLTSNDMDTGEKIVGLRFQNVTLPPGSVISNAYIQFTARNNDSSTGSLTIGVEANNNPLTFSSSDDDLSNRTLENNPVTWSPETWSSNDAGTAQRTADISSLIQTNIDRTGWASGNAISFIFGTSSNERAAHSFDTVPGSAARLVIEYQDNNPTPSVSITAPTDGASVPAGDSINFTGTSTDIEDGDLSASISWTSDLDGALGAGASISTALSTGTHTITASVTDSSALTATATLMVTVYSTSDGSVLFEGHFDNSADSFVYSDDAFRNTSEPSYASGSYSSSGGFSGGGLSVQLGGVNSSDITGMSGGWSRSFTLNAPLALKVSLRYNISSSAGYESDEYGDVLVSLDGQLIGAPSNSDRVVRVTGNNQATGWVQIELDLGQVSSGNHTISLGGYNNKKTSSDESIDVLLDDISVIVDSAPLNQTPTVQITTPANGSSINEGSAVTMTGTATDPEDGDLAATIIWSSDRDGDLGTGATITPTLSVGTHTITATVTDSGSEPGSNNITLTVNPTGGGGGAQTLEIPIILGSDDAEETSSGTMMLTGNDMDIGEFLMGLRFQNVTIPSDATITNAYVQFTADEAQSAGLTLNIDAEAQSNPPTFSSSSSNISDRTLTTVPVSWSPVPWASVGDAGVAERTPDIKSLIQASIERAGWVSGNAIVLVFSESNSNRRAAESFESVPTATAKLVIEYQEAGQNNEIPVVSITSPANAAVVTAGESITFAGTANDTEDGDLSSAIVWSSSIDGNLGAGASISASLSAGSHTITATATDSDSDPGTTTISLVANTLPTVTITDPVDGSTFSDGVSVSFTGTANDAEDGDLSTSITWSSDLDGNLGTGATISTTLSAGNHTITASVTDSSGANKVSTVAITSNSGPIVSITSPLEGATVPANESITLTATANDTEDGDLGASVIWVSDLDGSLGTGASISASLSAGNHTITASATDSSSLTGTKSISLISNTDPTVSITAPIEGSKFTEGEAVSFTGAANDAEDGDLSASVAWTSDLDGSIGTGSSISATLTSGSHVVTASVTDSNGVTKTANVSIASNSAPTVSITAPTDGMVISVGDTINFTATATDDSDGDLSAAIVWVSDIDGNLGTGAAISAILTAGSHTITASATDSDAILGSTNITLISNAAPIVSITAPADGTVVPVGDTVNFTATATDTEDGDLSASIVWVSSIDGNLGTGTAISTTLTAGTHVITASANDSNNLTGTANINLVSNSAPAVSITAPANGVVISQGDSINFTATAADGEDGDLAASITWVSSIDGNLGTGAAISTTLSAGSHTISASAIDSNNLTGSASITLISNAAPVVSITAPTDNAIHLVGNAINFTATAADTEDGDLTAAITWSSNLDGNLGTGAAISTVLSAGTHTITASAIDSNSITGTASITLISNTAPSVSITTPVAGSEFILGAAIGLTGTASDAEDGDLAGSISWTSSINGSLGSGLSVNASLDLGGHTITAAVTDSHGQTTTATTTLTVIALNQSPQISSTPGTAAAVGVAYSYDVEATDPETNPLTYSLIAAPSGMTIDPGTGLINWIPTAKGSFNVTVQVSDNLSVAATQLFTVVVPNRPPVFTSAAITSAIVGQLYTYNANVSDPDLTDTINYSLINFPSGMTIDANSGVISWTPSTAGDSDVTVQADDGDQGIVTQVFTITSELPNNDPVISSTPVIVSTVDSLYQYQVVATSPISAPLTYSLPAAPLGMTISSDGFISWTPLTAGTFQVMLKVEDNLGSMSVQDFSITVSYGPGSQPPGLMPVGDQIVTLGTTLTLELSATDPDGNDLSYIAEPMPLKEGMYLNSTTGVFTFTPALGQEGNHDITFIATDGRFSDSEQITINVPPASGVTALHGLVLTTNGAPLANVRLEISGVETVSDANGQYLLNNLPVAGTVRLLVDGSTVDPGLGTFATVPETITLISGTDNLLDPPIVLLPLDVGSADMVSSTQVSIIDSSRLIDDTHVYEPVTLTIPAGSARMESGELFEGAIHISSIPDPTQGPRPLPADIDLSVYIAVQPFGVVYDPPAPISFPNIENFPPGSILDFFALNHDNGQFEKIGEGTVNANGKTVDSNGGVVLANSWHGIVPQAPVVSPDNDDGSDRGKGCKESPACTFSLETGNLGEDHKLPAYYSLGTERSVHLNYNSMNAHPKPIITTEVGVGNLAPPPSSMSMLLSIGGIEQGAETFGEPSIVPTTSFGQFFTSRPALQFDGRPFNTGVYDYAMTNNCHFEISRRSETLIGDVIIQNDMHSPFGSGWTINGLQQIHINETDQADLLTAKVLLTEGDGVGLVFTPTDATAYDSPLGDYSTLTRNGDNTFTRVMKNGTTYEFDVDGYQTSMVDRNNNTTTYLYDTDNRLDRIQDPLGKEFVFNYISGRIDSITDPANRVTRFKHDSAGNLIEIIEPNGDNRKFEYDPDSSLMKAQIDQRTNRTEYQYDFAGRIQGATLPDGTNPILQANKTDGLADLSGGLGTDKDNLLPAPILHKDVASEFTDHNGNSESTETDPLGAPTKVTDAIDRETVIERDANSNPTKITRSNQSIVTQTFDNKGNTEFRKEQFNQAEYKYTYDAFSLVTRIENPNTHALTLNRNPTTGNVESIVNHLNHTLSFQYDPDGLPNRMEEPNGLVTTYTYYSGSRLLATVTETPPVSSTDTVRVTNYEYFDSGLLKQVIMPDTLVFDMAYDDKGRLITVTDNLNQSITYGYDAHDNLTSVDTNDPDSSLTRAMSQVYDQRNRLVEMRAPHLAEESITQLTLDGNGNLLNLIDPNSNSLPEDNVYDGVDRLTQSMHREGGLTQYAYDNLNRVTKVTAPNGVVTDYTYDLLGRRTSETSPDRGQVTYDIYDVANNLKQMTDGRGIISTYTYDELGRLRTTTYPNNISGKDEAITFTYDQGTNGHVCDFGIGRLCEVTSESGVTKYRYDSFGNVIEQSHTELGITYTTSYKYNDGDQLTQVTYPSGRVVDITRDAVRRLEGINTTIDSQPQSIVSNLKYQSDNQMTQCTFGNGLIDDRDYDLQGRLTLQTLKDDISNVLDQRTYTYDKNSNLTNRDTTPQLSGNAYDKRDRLISDTVGSDAPFSFLYDLNDNRTYRGQSGLNLQLDEDYTYQNGSNRLLSFNTLLTGDTLNNIANRALVYNDAGRLYQLYEAGFLKASYIYNAYGQRTRKLGYESDVVVSTTIYHYDLSGHLISETDGLGNLIKDYIWSDGLHPIAQVDNTLGTEQVVYLHTDHLMTARLATDDGQSVAWRWDGEAFGSAEPEELLSYSINLRFPGQYYDGETKLYYNHHRYYDPVLGRYITSDPIGLAGGLNTYAYVGGNPLGRGDPTGEVIPAILWGIGAGLFVGDLFSPMEQHPDYPDDAIEPVWTLPGPLGGVGKGKKLGEACDDIGDVNPGDFNIPDWKGYPDGLPKPEGPFRLIEGAEYDAARKAANAANQKIRKANDLIGKPVDVHEVKPVKFGGSPTDPANKVIIDRGLHRKQVTPWWNQLQKNVGG